MSNTKKSWFDELTESMRTAFDHAHEEQECPRSAVASVKFNDGYDLCNDFRKAICMVMKSFYMDGNAVCGDAANVVK